MTVTSFSLIKSGPAFGVRHLQVLFLFTCAVLAIQMRINFSVGIVAMTNANTTNPDYQEYAWSERQKSVMLSALFWGAIFTQLPGGFLSSRYGAKTLLLGCILGTSVVSIAIPWALAVGGWRLFCVCRLLQGLFQGVMFPCFYSHLAKWCPVEERNRLGGITQMGMDVGTILGFAVSGLLATSPLGWPSMFYVPGLLGIVWSALWLVYGANSPQESRFISLAEQKLVHLSLQRKDSAPAIPTAAKGASDAGGVDGVGEQNSPAASPQISSVSSVSPVPPLPPVPWRAIVTSVPFLALSVCKCSQACSYYTLMQQIPTYIHGVFRFELRVNALLSALPYVLMCGMSYVCLALADLLTHSQFASLAVVRKSINTFASWVPAVALLALGYTSAENVGGSVACLMVAVAANAAQVIGSSLNHIDLSPNHAGVLFGLNNTLMSIVGVVSPLAVGVVVTDEGDRSQWRLVFVTMAVILFLGNLLYILFGQMEAQPWNELSSTTKPNPPTNDLSLGPDESPPVLESPGSQVEQEEEQTEKFKSLA